MDGVATYSIKGPGGDVAGAAYVFESYAGVLYITLQFNCSYMFSTDPLFSDYLVKVQVWDSNQYQASSLYQYIDVIYAKGYYSCYTLAVTLNSVCNIDQNATFNASPNDPNLVNCTCPGNQCPPGTSAYSDLSQVDACKSHDAASNCSEGHQVSFSLRHFSSCLCSQASFSSLPRSFSARIHLPALALPAAQAR